MSAIYDHTNYLVRKKVLKLFGETFHVFDPSGNVIFYAKQKAFKLKEDIRLYTGEDMRTELLTVKARQAIDLSATYDVIDATSGEKVGALRRKGLKSILKDEWLFLGPDDNEIGLIKEDNAALALLRRFLTSLIPQQLYAEIGGREVCVFKQNFNPFVTKINVDFSHNTDGLLDRRLGIAAAVLLCAIEGKQG